MIKLDLQYKKLTGQNFLGMKITAYNSETGDKCETEFRFNFFDQLTKSDLDVLCMEITNSYNVCAEKVIKDKEEKDNARLSRRF